MTSLLERYQRIAPVYDLLDYPFEHGRYRAIRPLLFAGLSGRILDAGIGTGRNIPFYPQHADVTGIDRSPAMLARAARRRDALGARAELKLMDVSRLDFADATFDAVVATFLFCVLPEEQQVPALRELARVTRPGAPIRILEYTRPTAPLRRLSARLWSPWMHWAYGAGFDRDTEAHIPKAGLAVTGARFVVADLIKLIEARTPAPPSGESSPVARSFS